MEDNERHSPPVHPAIRPLRLPDHLIDEPQQERANHSERVFALRVNHCIFEKPRNAVAPLRCLPKQGLYMENGERLI